jgi:cell pole-organizing protein PopZ
MKRFIEFINEEYDIRADINVPYKTPEDIAKIMGMGNAGDSDAPGPAPRKKRTSSEINQKRREKNKVRAQESSTDMRNNSGDMTLRDIGKKFGVSHEAIAKSERSAFDKIAKAMEELKADPSMMQAWTDVNRPRSKNRDARTS